MNAPARPAADRDPTPGDSYVQSFARGLAVIRSFSAQAPAQSLSEVALRSGLTRAGARRILLTLQALGYVELQGRQFRLTPKILDLGFAYLSSLPLWTLSEPVMQSLVREVRESCAAAVLDGAEVVYVRRMSTYKVLSIALGVGSRLPAYCTSLGRVLLSGLPDAVVRTTLAAAPRPHRTSRTVTDLDALLERVRQARHQGWCLVDQELEEGLVSLAAPVCDATGRVIAALNVSGQANRTSPQDMVQRFLPPLRDAARTLSALLAGNP